MNTTSHFQSGYVALVGKPNVGKSTLLNVFLDQKLSIVSPKPQTTRHQLAGILSGDKYQIVFLDTPGLLNPSYQLHQYMLKIGLNSFESADVILYMTDVQSPPSYLFENIPSTIKHNLKKRTNLGHLLVINKIDLIDKTKLLPLIDAYHQQGLFDEIIPISALKKIETDQLLKNVLNYIPEGPAFYPAEQIADVSERFICAEMVREQIFLLTRDEIPYAVTVLIDQFQERGTKLFISATIYVMRASQKAVVIGKNGAMIKKIGANARVEIERFLDRKVFLELWVKIRENWRANENDLRFFGYN